MYCWKRSSGSPPRCPNFTAGTFTNVTSQQSLAHHRSHRPYLHLFHHHMWWKSTSSQLTQSRSPLFTPLLPQLCAQRLPCLMPCSWAPETMRILSPQTTSSSNLEELWALNVSDHTSEFNKTCNLLQDIHSLTELPATEQLIYEKSVLRAFRMNRKNVSYKIMAWLPLKVYVENWHLISLIIHTTAIKEKGLLPWRDK